MKKRSVRSFQIVVGTVMLFTQIVIAQDSSIEPVPFDNSKVTEEATDSTAGQGARAQTTTSQIYTIRSGDTMWDICKIVLDNPWYWPKLWSFNQYILNPNLIYPGNRLAFYPGSETSFPKFEVVQGDEERPAFAEEAESPVNTSTETVNRTSFIVEESSLRKGESLSVKLKAVSFVTKKDLGTVGKILHSGEPKMILSVGDKVYLKMYKKMDLKAGDKFVVVEKVKTVYDPDRETQKIGAMIHKKAEVTVSRVTGESNWRKRTIEATISDGNDIVLRNDELLPYQSSIVSVVPHYTDKSIRGKIIEADAEQFLISNNDFVFLNIGTKDGLQPGLQLFVVRTGDGLDPDEGQELPDVPIAKILIVESREKTATAYVTTLDKPLAVGDRVKSKVE